MVVVDAWGWKRTAMGNGSGTQKYKHTCLHLCVRSLMSVDTRLLPGTLRLGLTGRECLWHAASGDGAAAELHQPPCLISGHLHHPQNANYLQHGALTQKSEGRQAYRQPRSPRCIKCTHTVSSLLAKGRQTLPASLVWGCHAPCS